MRWYAPWLLLGFLGAFSAPASCQPAAPSGKGTPVRTTATGWFYAQKFDSRWWLVDPQGYTFFSVGVNEITLSIPGATPDVSKAYRAVLLRRYETIPNWGEACVSRLRSWGFNTVGVPADYPVRSQHIPYMLSLEATEKLRQVDKNAFPDVFSPKFFREAQLAARRICRAAADDPLLIGYLTDTSLLWPVPGEDSESPFVQYLRLGNYAPGRAALLEFLEERYLQIEDLNEAWHAEYQSFAEIGRVPQVGASIPLDDKMDFLHLVAEQYFRTLHDTIREFDTHHLIFGCRFTTPPPRAVLEAMRGYADVISLTTTGLPPSVEMLRETYRVTNLPLLLTQEEPKEKSESEESSIERGRLYARTASELMALPMVVGYHWFYFVGSPTETGAGHWGLVDPADEPQREFVEAVTQANRDAVRVHTGKNARPKPTASR